MISLIKNNFKFVFTIIWVTLLYSQINQTIINQTELLNKLNELNHKHIVYKIKCLNDKSDSDHLDRFNEYVESL